MRKRLIIGMSGASGAPLTIELLKQLQQYKEIIETHLIVTKGAEMTLEQETDYTLEQLYAHADEVHDNYNIGAGPASGSYRTMGMIVIPCSMKTLAGIVSGYSDNLVLRAADITLKERRKKISLPENGLSRYGNLSNNRCLCQQSGYQINCSKTQNKNCDCGIQNVVKTYKRNIEIQWCYNFSDNEIRSLCRTGKSL